MLVYGQEAIDTGVKIDESHSKLVHALVLCRKPRQVLELGFGTGEATRAILTALQYNTRGYDYTVVDNWFDFDGVPPPIINDAMYASINFVTRSERDYLSGCTATYDFIFSDADHFNTQNWFEQVYSRFLARGGILMYHDVTNAAVFPNLLRILEDTIRGGYHYALFNENSRPNECCDRGLLAIFKH
jgi:predicted O-methyltransferase YrrM